jgi:hypothetical protein
VTNSAFPGNSPVGAQSDGDFGGNSAQIPENVPPRRRWLRILLAIVVFVVLVVLVACWWV